MKSEEAIQNAIKRTTQRLEAAKGSRNFAEGKWRTAIEQNQHFEKMTLNWEAEVRALMDELAALQIAADHERFELQAKRSPLDFDVPEPAPPKASYEDVKAFESRVGAAIIGERQRIVEEAVNAEHMREFLATSGDEHALACEQCSFLSKGEGYGPTAALREHMLTEHPTHNDHGQPVKAKQQFPYDKHGKMGEPGQVMRTCEGGFEWVDPAGSPGSGTAPGEPFGPEPIICDRCEEPEPCKCYDETLAEPEPEGVRGLVDDLHDLLLEREWVFDDNPTDSNTCLSCGAKHGSSFPDGPLHKDDCAYQDAMARALIFIGE